MGYISNELDDWNRVYKLYDDIKILLLQSENITISELNALIEQIIQYDKVNEEKAKYREKIATILRRHRQ